MIFFPVLAFAQEPSFDDQFVSSTEYTKLMERLKTLETGNSDLITKTNALQNLNAELNSKIEQLKIELSYRIEQSDNGLTFATLGVAIATILLVLVSTLHSRKQNEISKKHIEYLGMLEIMRFFHDPQIAKDRDRIIRANRTNSLYDKEGEFQGLDVGVMVASVRGTFDQMGKLVLDKYVDKEQFFNMYADSVIVMYKILQKHIDRERTKRKSKFLAHNFETIFNEAKVYWKTNYPDEPEPEPF